MYFWHFFKEYFDVHGPQVKKKCKKFKLRIESEAAVYIHADSYNVWLTTCLVTWCTDNHLKIDISRAKKACGGLQCFEYECCCNESSDTWILYLPLHLLHTIPLVKNGFIITQGLETTKSVHPSVKVNVRAKFEEFVFLRYCIHKNGMDGQAENRPTSSVGIKIRHWQIANQQDRSGYVE